MELLTAEWVTVLQKSLEAEAALQKSLEALETKQKARSEADREVLTLRG